MKYLLFNLMLFFRGFFFSVVKIVAVVFFVGGIAGVIVHETVWGKCYAGFFIICPFLLFLLRQRYDHILFKLCPDDITLKLNVY